MLNVAGILFFGQISRDVGIRKTAAEPGEIPRQKRDDDEKGRDNDQPEIGGPLWFRCGRSCTLAVGAYEFIFHFSIGYLTTADGGTALNRIPKSPGFNR